MSYIAYGFVEKNMYGDGDCTVEVFKSHAEAYEAMEDRAYKEIGLFVRDFGYAPVVIDNRDKHQITIIHCGVKEYEHLLMTDDEIPETDYRVIEVHVNY